MTGHTRRIFLPITFGVFLVTAALGCGGSGGSTEYTTGGVKVKVLHPPSGGSHSSGTHEGDYSWTNFQWKDTQWKPLTVVVDHLRLEVNGRDYGRLESGNEVVIDARPAEPTVAVNGTERAPSQRKTKKDDRDKPMVKEARGDTEAVLDGLLAGKYDSDPDLAPVARKVKGFQSWSIESQRVDSDNPKAVNFGGTLKGPQGEAAFTASMVKQRNGKWMIGHFSGPDRR